jgi:hypothetical protein
MAVTGQTKFNLAKFFVCLGVAFASSAGHAETAFQPRLLSQFLETQNWVALAIPDNKMRPGAVIKVQKKGDAVDVRWLGDFRSCGITDSEFGLVRGKYPPVGIGESFAVKASFAVSILAKLGGSAEVDKINGAILKIEEAGGDAIDLLAFSIWLTKPGNLQKLPEPCGTFLAQNDVYLVSEAFRVTRGSYDLIDKNGAKLAVSAAVAGRSIDAGIAGSISKSGTLSVTEDFYFGVRRVKQLAPGSFATLGSAPQAVPEADDLLRLAKP